MTGLALMIVWQIFDKCNSSEVGNIAEKNMVIIMITIVMVMIVRKVSYN